MALRVALLIRKWSLRGGNERVAVELGRQLSARGHRVRVLCQKHDPSAPLEGVELQRLRGLSFDPSLAMWSYARAARRALAALRDASQVDVAVGFNHSVEQDVYRLGGGTAAELAEIARTSPDARGGPVADRVALWLERKRFQPGAYLKLVAPSHRVKQELIRHYAVPESRIEVVWNGIDLARFTPEADPAERAEVRTRWGASPEEPLLLFVGQDPARKGFDVATRAAAALGLRLVYVGKAARPSRLPPHIIWDGERADVQRCYRAADVLLAPSRYDPFGGVVLEALACGLPAVATDRIGATERTRGTPLEALLFPDPEDSEAVVARVRRALDPIERPRLIAAARQATRDASREAWGARMEAVLAAAAEERTAR